VGHVDLAVPVWPVRAIRGADLMNGGKPVGRLVEVADGVSVRSVLPNDRDLVERLGGAEQRATE
jgi:hypothetical protein